MMGLILKSLTKIEDNESQGCEMIVQLWVSQSPRLLGSAKSKMCLSYTVHEHRALVDIIE